MIDFSRFIFHFESLPTDVKIMIMKQMSFNSLIKFRYACQHFFDLTENYPVSDYCPLDNDLNYGRWVSYRSHEKEFQSYFSERYIDVPTSKFWNHEQLRCRLMVSKVSDDDIYFMEKLKKIGIKFNPIQLMDVKISILDELFQHISYVKELLLFHPYFLSKEFLCSGLLKHIKGKINIYVCTWEENKSQWLPVLERRNVKGINFVIKKLANDSYNFEELKLSPLRSDIMLDDVMKNINYVSIFNPDCHLDTPLSRIPLEQLRETTTGSHVKYIVALKKVPSGGCYLITIHRRGMKIAKCAEDELISRALEHDLDTNIADKYSPYFVELVYKQKVFDNSDNCCVVCIGHQHMSCVLL